MFRRILIPVLVFIALLAIAGGAGYWVYNGYTYYSTDDAQVSGQVLNLTAPAAGTLTTLTGTVGPRGKAGDVLGTVTLPSRATAKSAPSTPTMNTPSPTGGTNAQVPDVHRPT